MNMRSQSNRQKKKAMMQFYEKQIGENNSKKLEELDLKKRDDEMVRKKQRNL